MKLAIIGSRSFDDLSLISSVLDDLLNANDIKMVISGGAIGADSIGVEWAKSKNIPSKIYFPEWDKYGKAAGLIRNRSIIDDCDTVIAFWDGKSKGTHYSINLAESCNKKVIIVKNKTKQ